MHLGPLVSIHCKRYGTRYYHPDKRFLEVPNTCPSVHKHFISHIFAFDAPIVWNDLPDDVCSAPNLSCFSKKKLKSYRFKKAFSTLADKLSGISELSPGYVSGMMK